MTFYNLNYPCLVIKWFEFLILRVIGVCIIILLFYLHSGCTTWHFTIWTTLALFLNGLSSWSWESLGFAGGFIIILFAQWLHHMTYLANNSFSNVKQQWRFGISFRRKTNYLFQLFLYLMQLFNSYWKKCHCTYEFDFFYENLNKLRDVHKKKLQHHWPLNMQVL